MNASVQESAGLKVSVTRIYDGVGLSNGRTCEWCLERCGTNMSYSEAYEKGAFQRHPGCGYELLYSVGKRTQRQTDWKSNKWESGNRKDLILAAENSIEKRQEERKRERLINLGTARSFQHELRAIETRKLEHFTRNNLYIANDVSLRPRDIRKIDAQITQAKEFFKQADDCKAAMVIINDDDILASYNPVSDTFFINAKIASEVEQKKMQLDFVCSDDTRSTMVHELFHWADAEEYRKDGNIIESATPYSTYSVYQREKAYMALIENGIDLNINNIREELSPYASRKLLENDYEEVYTEYRTKKMLSES